MLEIKNLKKKLNDFTLEIDNLTIKDDDYFIFLGLSGSGKTTLLEIMAGFSKADSGTILLDGKDITNKPINKRNIALCNGKYLFPHLTISKNIELGIKNNSNKNDKIEIIENIAKTLKIKHLLNRYPKNLSMGERQRVSLAMALAMEPRIILLDEPLSSLDRLIHEELLYELREIYHNSNNTTTTIIHVTHDFNEAIALSNNIAILNKGKIEQMGNIKEILRYPKSEFVAKFTGLRNLLNGRVIKQLNENEEIYLFKNENITIQLNGNDKRITKFIDNSKNQIYKKALLGVRPEEIMIINNCKCHYRNENMYSGKIIEIFHSSLCTYQIIIDANNLNLICEVVKCHVDKMKLKIGSKITFCINNAMIIYDPSNK
ncbi:ABC transporter related [Methanococcus aeolicus Nankai-3]|uniref:Molybdate/tungstate import ATP-binding protein WtpC n=1 Tax=Methanococcus aeolicus (strain ATCC BAA-1280 / DSM 17508 / OCM 812 / Nankai-3) TaxID=419665 RepID=A6UWX6_META3|nr:ATP-binding cassette domain-containing protein [Methanococcus aeolicus]ABR56998.1 ABC transporter related [Methanococcus aeolicus Nankai-3]